MQLFFVRIARSWADQTTEDTKRWNHVLKSWYVFDEQRTGRRADCAATCRACDVRYTWTKRSDTCRNNSKSSWEAGRSIVSEAVICRQSCVRCSGWRIIRELEAWVGYLRSNAWAQVRSRRLFRLSDQLEPCPCDTAPPSSLAWFCHNMNLVVDNFWHCGVQSDGLDSAPANRI